ncbi:MAG: hypothetical protein QMC79_00110 [Anaerosomatales bacterium]|nr:hypothetical protein [Anaerosomatales bacterium]
MTERALDLQRRPFAFGLSLIPAEALDPLSRHDVAPPEAIAEACEELAAAFAFVPSWEPWAADAITILSDRDVSPFWVVEGPLWPVLRERGIERGLRETLTAQGEIASAIGARLEALAEEVRRGIGLGARAVVIAEDLAGSEGPLVAPDFAISVLVPALKRLTGIADAAGVPAALHSDGDVRPLLAAAKRAGFAALHAGGGLSFEAFERLFWAARAEGLAVIGGLQTVELNGFPAAESLGSRVGLLAQAGGLLVADDGGITEPLHVTLLVSALMAARDAGATT